MQVTDHFTYKKIIRLSVAPVTMMIFTSMYSVVDGLFLSNFAGKEAFAAVSFIMPYLMMFNSVGFMFGTGGSALIAKKLGEKQERDADEIFTTLMWFALGIGTALSAVGQVFLKPIAVMQGAENLLLTYSVQYGCRYFLGTGACVVQFSFQALYSTAGKGKLGLYSTVASGLMNIVLDAVFLGVFHMGIAGAAIATVVSQWMGGLLPFLYFGRKNNSLLRMVRCKPHIKDMGRICVNGSSEMVNNISISIVSLLYNMQLLAYAGDNGIAAYGIMMYVNFLFTAVFWGYITAVAPIISFHFGARNHRELHNLLCKSAVLIVCCSVTMLVISQILAVPISSVFVKDDETLLKMTIHGFSLFSCTFLFAGMSIFFSSFFTALNNGLISAILSFSRVFLFQIPSVLLLPLIWKLDGIWLSVVVAECCTVLMGIVFLLCNRKKYQY